MGQHSACARDGRGIGLHGAPGLTAPASHTIGADDTPRFQRVHRLLCSPFVEEEAFRARLRRRARRYQHHPALSLGQSARAAVVVGLFRPRLLSRDQPGTARAAIRSAAAFPGIRAGRPARAAPAGRSAVHRQRGRSRARRAVRDGARWSTCWRMIVRRPSPYFDPAWYAGEPGGPPRAPVAAFPHRRLAAGRRQIAGSMPTGTRNQRGFAEGRLWRAASLHRRRRFGSKRLASAAASTGGCIGAATSMSPMPACRRCATT